MSKLDPRIEEIRARYGLMEGDFWQIPQNKQWVCKHAALEIVATKANVEWSAPQIIEASYAGFWVIRPDQAARFSATLVATPSVNVTPSMSKGNWFAPFRRRHVLAAA